jgi:branched-chain amino acid aminotransferase
VSGNIILNGEMTRPEACGLGVLNRAFRYGDGFFDTFRTHTGRPVLFGPHWTRIERTARFLRFSLSTELSSACIAEHVKRLCEANNTPHARVRLQFWRDGGGLYIPESNTCNWLMETTPLPSSYFEVNRKGMTLGICREIRVNPQPLSSHKTLNALPYVIAGTNARERGWDDALLLDHAGNVAEATSSNLLLVKEKVIVTPDLKHGGLPGTMRDEVLRLAKGAGMKVVETSVSEKDLELADELLLTNAVAGIRWVLGCGTEAVFPPHCGQIDHTAQRGGSAQLRRGSSGRFTM